MTKDGMTTIERLGERVSAHGTVSGALRCPISLHIADTAAAWVAGARASEGRSLLRFIALQDKPGAMDRVMLHCALARLSELDDIHLASCTTPGAVIIPAALTLGAERGAPAQALAEAIFAGYEAMTGLGLALNGPSILYRGIWPTYFTAAFGVAAVASRLFELDARQAAHALGLALAFASPGVGHPGGPETARWLALGHAARHGGTAALAAQAGFTADLELLDRDFLASIYTISPYLAALGDAPGTRFGEISFKPWCAARQTMAAAQAVKEMVHEGLEPADISAVSVAVPPPYLRMVNHGITSGDRSSYLTSAPYQIALSVLAPQEQLRITAPPGELAQDLLALMSKVSVQADERLLEHYPRSWPAHVRVSARSGERGKLVLHVPGDPQRAFGEQEIADKCARVLSPLVGAQRAARLLRCALAVLDAPGNAASLLSEIETLCRGG